MAEKKNIPLDPVYRAFLEDHIIDESPDSSSEMPSNSSEEVTPAEVPVTE